MSLWIYICLVVGGTILLLTLSSVQQWAEKKLLESRVNRIWDMGKEKPFQFTYKGKDVEMYDVLEKGKCPLNSYSPYSLQTIYINGNPIAVIHKFDNYIVSNRIIHYNDDYKTEKFGLLVKAACKAYKKQWNQAYEESCKTKQDIV